MMWFQKKDVYLDWAAAAPVLPAAKNAFERGLEAYGNPSSAHTVGRAAHAILEDARVRIARLAGTKADAVIFTSGATEANALGIVGQMHARIAAGTPATAMEVLYLPSAHASTLGAMEGLRALGVRTALLTLSNGAIDLKKLALQIRPATVLVCVDAIDSETGTEFAVRDVRRALDVARKNGGERILLHVDASQAPLIESFELGRLGADMLTLDAQKVGGVRGIGALIAPRHVQLAPLTQGGGQERGLRPGTESPALAASFALALEMAHEGKDAFKMRAREMRRALLEGSISKLPDVVVNEGAASAPHILNISLMGRDTDYAQALLSEAGFFVSTRSACETDSEGSRSVLVLTADAARSASTLRISWGPSVSTAELSRFARALRKTLHFLDTGKAIY